MKYAIALLFLFSGLFCKADDNFDPRDSDKQLHMLASYGLGMTSTLLFEKHNFSRLDSIVYGCLLTLSVGLAKEYVYDKTPSNGDLIADGIGTATSALVVYTFNF